MHACIASAADKKADAGAVQPARVFCHAAEAKISTLPCNSFPQHPPGAMLTTICSATCRCLIDYVPREFDAECCAILCNFAEVVVRDTERYTALAVTTAHLQVCRFVAASQPPTAVSCYLHSQASQSLPAACGGAAALLGWTGYVNPCPFCTPFYVQKPSLNSRRPWRRRRSNCDSCPRRGGRDWRQLSTAHRHR